LQTDRCRKPERYRVDTVHRSQHQNITRPLRGVAGNKRYETRSVAAGFGRHSMPQPVTNDTGTALGQDDSD